MTTFYYERALNQTVYPGVGDIDDCWVVATIWAIRRQTRQTTNLPNAKVFRAAARDPDDGYNDGGTLSEIWLGAVTLYPHIKFVKFSRQYGWSSFVSYLNKGYTASLAVRSAYLPRSMRYGFLGAHQIAVFKKDGKFYIMNPLQPKGSAPTRISETSLKSATYHFANSWVMAMLVPPINLGRFAIRKSTVPRAYRRYYKGARVWSRSLRYTRGWSAVACPPTYFTIYGKRRRLCFISTGINAGKYVELTGTARTYTP